MLNFPEQKELNNHLYIEETDAPLPETLNPNTRYALFKTIATGGKSLIKSCRDLHLGRTVCYKTLRPEFQKDPIENKRLLREARISALLQHPNTIPTHEIGRDNRGNYYFTIMFKCSIVNMFCKYTHKRCIYYARSQRAQRLFGAGCR